MTDNNRPIIDTAFKERLISWIVLVLIFITVVWYMLDIFLLTFIITFVFYKLIKVLKRKRSKNILCRIPDAVALTILYVIFILILIFASIVLAPNLAAFFTDLANILINFNAEAFKASLDPRLAEVIGDMDFNTYIEQAGIQLAWGVTAIGGFGLNFFLALILSFLLLLEKNKIAKFGERMADSRISFFYEYLMTFGRNFCTTFGKVMKVQVIIAIVNSIISMILLGIMGFPQIPSLGAMIFLLGLIPVAGVIISLVPLCIIAFNIGGITKVVAVILMIVLIHAIEAYILNPKLMSDRTELPVCFIFIILLVSEHYLGIWGLLIGVPIFIFLMNAMEVNFSGAFHKEKKECKTHKGKKDKITFK